MGRGVDVLLAPVGAALAKDFGGKSASGDGLDGADCYLVHKAGDGEIAVLCVLARERSGDPLFGVADNEEVKREGKPIAVSIVVDPHTDLSVMHAYTRYSGCFVPSREDLSPAWLILSEPDEMTRSQVSALLERDLSGPPARGRSG